MIRLATFILGVKDHLEFILRIVLIFCICKPEQKGKAQRVRSMWTAEY